MKNYMLIGFALLVAAIIFITGCLSDSLMPADKSPIAVKYVIENDPCLAKSISSGKNSFGYNNLAGAKQNVAAVNYVHAMNQANYAYLTDKDDKAYSLAKNEAETNYKEAQTISDTIWGATGIGTILSSALIAGIATRIHALQTLSTDSEVQVAVDKAVKNETEKLYTQAEVDNLLRGKS